MKRSAGELLAFIRSVHGDELETKRCRRPQLSAGNVENKAGDDGEGIRENQMEIELIRESQCCDVTGNVSLGACDLFCSIAKTRD